jgi:hypothetical protein
MKSNKRFAKPQSTHHHPSKQYSLMVDWHPLRAPKSVQVKQEDEDISSNHSLGIEDFAAETRASRMWDVLRKSVVRGDFLVDKEQKEEASKRATTPLQRQERIEKAQKEIRKYLSYSGFQCVLAISAYIAFSVLMYSFVLEDWPIIDSCYFAVTTFTTIGYGDLVPDNDLSRLFTCIYALGGVGK